MRQMINWTAALLLVGGMMVGALVVATDGSGLSGAQTGRSTTSTDPLVTPVSGPSWLNHLGIRYTDTSLGRGAGRYGPAPDAATEPKPLLLPATRTAVLTGADLYRLNCQACHRAEGTGAPPEVRSVLPAVQGSSFEIMRRRLQGQTGGATAARQESNQAKLDLYRRIQKGGQRMPPRAHLQKAEIDMLYGYLTRLAGTPDAPVESHETMSWARLGENVIKGTCHICHDAVGPRPTGEAALLQGAIPPLSSLLADKPIVDFVNKVRSGAPVVMSDLPFHYRGRMPVFYYLTDQEIAAAYVFLNTYPPQPK
jgi:mono/diheme cytochrome c family protein